MRELGEDRVDRLQVGVVIEMLRFDIQNKCMPRVVIYECAVTLIPFGDKMLSFGIPACIRT